MWLASLLAFALVLFPILTQAGTGTATYTEPSLTQAGTPLTDLSSTTLYLKQDNGAEQKVVTPASKPQGGGAISKTFNYVSPAACASTTVVAQATASNAIESPRTPIASVTKTGTPPPGDPTCLTPIAPGAVTLTLGP